MAHSLSAQKRVRQNLKTRARNRWRKGAMREVIKSFLEKVSHATVADAQAAFKAAVVIIDKTAGKGVIHKNQAARRKSRLNARLKARVINEKNGVVLAKKTKKGS